jgi:hypothetical protein
MDAATFGADVVAAVRSFLEQEVDPVIARLEKLEQRFASLPAPPEPVKIDAEDIARRAAEHILPQIKEMRSADADPEQVAMLVRSEAERILSGWEKPKDGVSPSDEEMQRRVDQSVQRAVSGLPAPKDGLNLASALIDRAGNLVLTLSDGQMKELGKVVGRDGVDADMAALERHVGEVIAALPKPKDGTDGIDGIGFDDMTCEIRDDGVYLVWDKGEVIKEARLPIPIDRGVYKEGQVYKQGDCVTWGGSLWIAQHDNPQKPESGNGFRLAVKKGRDGKDGVVKEQKPAGPVKVG